MKSHDSVGWVRSWVPCVNWHCHEDPWKPRVGHCSSISRLVPTQWWEPWFSGIISVRCQLHKAKRCLWVGRPVTSKLLSPGGHKGREGAGVMCPDGMEREGKDGYLFLLWELASPWYHRKPLTARPLNDKKCLFCIALWTWEVQSSRSTAQSHSSSLFWDPCWSGYSVAGLEGERSTGQEHPWKWAVCTQATFSKVFMIR